MLRRVLGTILNALPFMAIAAFIVCLLGWKALLIVGGINFLIVGVIYLGSYLIDLEENKRKTKEKSYEKITTVQGCFNPGSLGTSWNTELAKIEKPDPGHDALIYFNDLIPIECHCDDIHHSSQGTGRQAYDFEITVKVTSVKKEN